MALPGASAPGGKPAAFLVDADNFSDVPALESAWAQLQEHAGRVSVCRAYGAPARLQSLAGVWRSLGARTFPNLALEKNTTDAALIADAVALYFQQGVRLFAIASGDADFAPLAVRLREWGCEVWCFSMDGILFADAQAYYDRVVRCVPSPPVTAESLALAATVKKMPPPVAVAASAMAVLPAPPALDKPKPLPLTPPSSVPLAILPEAVERILQALPALRGASQMLSQAVPVLREKNILSKTTKSTAFFALHRGYFKLSPAHQPTHLTYVPPSRVAQAAVTPQAKKSAQTGLKAAAQLAPTRTSAVLSWPTGIGRRPAPPLLAELHGLRSVLIQRAVRGVTVADVLLAVPELLRGQPCALSAVAGRLREKGLLHPSQSALRILERHPGAFGVEMGCVPQAVIYLQ